jgi:NADH-quinone oxidoreductase subunit L
MIIPLQILAILSALGGLMGIPHMSWLEHWLEPVIPAHEGALSIAPAMEWVLMGVSVAGAILGIAFALNLYRNLPKAAQLKQQFASIYRVLENKWYVDEIYNAIFVRPIQLLSQGIWKGIDVGVIDRIVVGFGRVSEWTGQTVRILQTGSIQVYAFMLLIGLVITAGYLVYGLV